MFLNKICELKNQMPSHSRKSVGSDGDGEFDDDYRKKRDRNNQVFYYYSFRI